MITLDCMEKKVKLLAESLETYYGFGQDDIYFEYRKGFFQVLRSLSYANKEDEVIFSNSSRWDFEAGLNAMLKTLDIKKSFDEKKKEQDKGE